MVTIGIATGNIQRVQGGPGAELGRSSATTAEYRRLADGFTTRLDLLMHSKRLLLSRREQDAETSEADRLRRDLERLQASRDYWVLRCSPDDPRFWIGAYGRLLVLYEQAIRESPPGEDAAQLRDAATQYRMRLQGWRRKAAE